MLFDILKSSTFKKKLSTNMNSFLHCLNCDTYKYNSIKLMKIHNQMSYLKPMLAIFKG